MDAEDSRCDLSSHSKSKVAINRPPGPFICEVEENKVKNETIIKLSGWRDKYSNQDKQRWRMNPNSA